MGAVQILTHSMVQSIEENSVRKGFDPRDFALVAEGGAGPLFAAQIALEVGTPYVLVPPYPGVTAAMGLLATDMVYEYVSTTYQRLSTLDAPALQRAFEELEEQARAQLEEDGVPADRIVDPAHRRLPLPRPGLRAARRRRLPARSTTAWVEQAARRLPRHPRARVLAPLRGRGHRDPERPRARDRAHAAARDARRSSTATESPDEALRHEARGVVPGRRRARAGRRRATTTAPRSERATGSTGPAIVNQYDSTTVDPAGGRSARRPLREHRDRGRGVGRGPARCAAGPTEVSDVSVIDYEVGRQPGPPTRARVEVDPITLRVLGGAFHAIAKEMAGVLFRMTLLLDHPRVGGPRRRHLRRRGPRALRVRLDADAHRLAALVHPRLPAPARAARSRRAT